MLFISGCGKNSNGGIFSGKKEVYLLTKITTHENGNEEIIEFSYDDNGNIINMKGYYNGNPMYTSDQSVFCWITYEYDDNENRTKNIRYREDGSTYVSYEASYVFVNLLKSETIYDENGNIIQRTENVYDDDKNLISNSIYNEEGKIKESSSNQYSNNQLIKVKKYYNEQYWDETYKYNENGDIVEHIILSDRGRESAHDTYEYDENGLIKKSIESNNFKKEVREYVNGIIRIIKSYDSDGNLNWKRTLTYGISIGIQNNLDLKFSFLCLMRRKF